MIFIRDEINVHMSISRVVGYLSIAIRELGGPRVSLRWFPRGSIQLLTGQSQTIWFLTIEKAIQSAATTFWTPTAGN